MQQELQAIGAALTGLRAASDLTKAFLDVKGAVDVQAKVFELQRIILAAQQDTFAAQQSQSALLEQKHALEDRVRDLEAWGREKERYQLEPCGDGGFAYSLKSEAGGSDPPHKICPHCYEDGRKSILTKFVYDAGRCQTLRCQRCGSEIAMHGIIPHGHTRPAGRAGAFGREGR